MGEHGEIYSQIEEEGEVGDREKKEKKVLNLILLLFRWNIIFLYFNV